MDEDSEEIMFEELLTQPSERSIQEARFLKVPKDPKLEIRVERKRE